MNTTDNKSKLWIKFKSATGEIVRISNRELSAASSHFITTQVDANDALINALEGRVSLKKIKAIDEFEGEGYVVVEKSDIVVLKALSWRFTKIQQGNPLKSDLNLEVYKKSNKIKISINTDSIRNSMNISELNELIVNDNALLNIYVTKLDDPDSLIETIEVSPVNLFKQREIMVQTNINEHADWNNISFYTTPILHSYSVNYSDLDLEEGEDSTDNKYLQEATVNESQRHINITGRGQTFQIDSSLINHNNSYILDGKRYIRFLVCGDTVDHLYGGFRLSTEDLITKNKKEVTVDFRIPDNPKIFYQAKDVTVNYLGEKYVNQH